MRRELEFGYNRDKKKGKKQIVIGLLTNDEGYPISVQVYRGNTKDTETFKDQVQKIAKTYKIPHVTFVGDRGMIKGPQIEDLTEEEFNYITAITKPQINKMLNEKVIDMSQFREDVHEVKNEARYILRRNPQREEEIQITRSEKLSALTNFVAQQNKYLADSSKADPIIAIRRCLEKAEILKVSQWITIRKWKRTIRLNVDNEKIKEDSKLDGCYVIKTELAEDVATSQQVHDRYKELAEVEWAFRTIKTTLLEIRSIFLRRADRTRGHVFTKSLSYCITYHLRRLWSDLEITVEEGIQELASICSTEIYNEKGFSCQTVPQPRKMGEELLKRLDLSLPEIIPHWDVKVATRKKLVSERKTWKKP